MKKADLVSSLVTFIVAVPLSLGIALASGASPAAGLLASIVGGIVVGMISGAPLMVSGPAAGLTVLVFEVIQTHGLRGLMVTTLLSGLFQIFFGVFRLGRIFEWIPKGVLNGMLGAIGLVIVLAQLHVIFGAVVPKNPLEAIQNLGQSISGLWGENWRIVLGTFVCGSLAILIQLFWPKLIPRLKWLPGALPAVFFSTLVGLFLEMQRVELQPIGEFVEASLATWTGFSLEEGVSVAFLLSALGLAVVGSAESMLTARAIGLISHKEAAKPKLNQELIAQGVGNVASGAIGGIPITGVIVRSAANVSFGAETRWASVFHGVWIAVFVFFFPEILRSIPLSALAAVLIVTGIKLLNIKTLIQTMRKSPLEGVYWMMTLVLIITTNLLSGLLVSLCFVMLSRLYLRYFSSSSERVIRDEKESDYKIASDRAVS